MKPKSRKIDDIRKRADAAFAAPDIQTAKEAFAPAAEGTTESLPDAQSGKKKSPWKKFLNIFFVLLTFGVIAVIGLTDDSGGDIFGALGSMQPGFLVAAFGCMLLYWAMDGATLNYTLRVMYKREKPAQSFRIALIGQLYAALTPSATGGQPVQMAMMKRNGIPFGVSSSVMVVKFIAFQSSVCIMFVLAAIFQSKVFVSALGTQIALMIFGFVVNFGALMVAILAMYHNAWLTKVVKGLLGFLHRIHIIKNLEKVQASALRGLNEYYQSMDAIKTMRRRIWIVLAMTVVQLTFYQSVVYFLYCSVGGAAAVTGMDYPTMLAMQIVLFAMVSFTPLPGASVASEGVFMWLYSDIMGAMTFPIMLVWRMFTFYGQIVAGALMLLWENIAVSRRRHRQAAEPSAPRE